MSSSWILSSNILIRINVTHMPNSIAMHGFKICNRITISKTQFPNYGFHSPNSKFRIPLFIIPNSTLRIPIPKFRIPLFKFLIPLSKFWMRNNVCGIWNPRLRTWNGESKFKIPNEEVESGKLRNRPFRGLNGILLFYHDR